MDSGIGSDLQGIFGGLFGNGKEPYDRAEKEYGDFYNRAQGNQNPFFQQGTNAIPQQQNWLNSQSDPSGFINHLMTQYQQSPWAKYQQDQATRAATNAASTGQGAQGGIGSTPFAQFNAQQAAGISSQDMKNWLASVLGINTQYGQGLQNEVTGGQNAANQMSANNRDFGDAIAKMQYGKYDAQNKQNSGLWGGLLDLGEKAGEAYFG